MQQYTTIHNKTKIKMCKYENCDREPYGKGEYCIFHCDKENFTEKEIEYFKIKFWGEFKAQEESEEKFNFIGFIFPDNFSFEKIEFKKSVKFEGAKFDDKANFEGAKFDGWAIFRDAKFDGLAIFRDAKFDGLASFWGATFCNETDFEGAKFDKNANFCGAKFNNSVKFIGNENSKLFSLDHDYIEYLKKGSPDDKLKKCFEEKVFLYLTNQKSFKKEPKNGIFQIKIEHIKSRKLKKMKIRQN